MRRNLSKIASLGAIIAVSAILGTLVSWRAPGIDRSARDWLIRARGPLPAPDDITIVAIDEPSIARFGRFPWPRAVMARAIDVLAAAQPRAIALDVLYVDPTTESGDSALAQSIQKAGNVVVAAQLVPPTTGGPTSWLLPLPAIERAAAAVGHVGVLIEPDGIARQILTTAADDQGRAIRAMAVEATRIGDGLADASVTETSHDLLLGSRVIPVESEDPSAVIGGVPGVSSSTQTLRDERITIDYIGPSGSYRTYSFADVLDGRVPASRFQGKYVLVGATAASLSDRLASPFVHQPDLHGNQHGFMMPGVEVLANTLNTILRSRFYSESPDWLAFLCGVLTAAITLFALTIAQGRHEGAKQIGALALLAGAVPLAGYFAYTRFLVFPPLTVALVSFASAGVLGLLRRSVVASSQLDRVIGDLGRAGETLNEVNFASAAASIARLAGAEGAAIYWCPAGGRMHLIAASGIEILTKRSGGFGLPAPRDLTHQLTTISTDKRDGGVTIVIAHSAARAPSAEIQQVSAVIADNTVEIWSANEKPSGSWWPRGLAWKARSLAHLNGRILDNVKFVDLAMRSVEDVLLVAAVDGRITFANRRAAAVLNSSEQTLRGRDLMQLLADSEQSSVEDGRSLLLRLIVSRARIEREITIRGVRPQHFTLRMAAVCSGEDGRGPVRGIVASLSDVTRQYELQQTKNDVMALVSHEMRTPLTAIQGMSELLSQFELDPERRREMSTAIHDEAKRLTHMISEYLDISRLESGATVLRRSPVRIQALVERTLLMLDPLAASRGIRLSRRLDSNVCVVIADSDLLARAISNLVSNAVKYSPRETEVVISAKDVANGVSIDVADRGYGIPEDSLGRVFDKFFRVLRVQDVDVPGTGLGLALVREIADVHGGSVAVRSSVGAGSVFTLWIPCSSSNAPEQEQ